MDRFYWLIQDEIAGCSRPGGHDRSSAWNGGSRPSSDDRLDRDLAWLREQRVGAVLSLTETELEAETLGRHGLAVLHLPIPDMTAPLPEQFQHALDFIDLQRSRGQAVAVHCLMGQGRTGTILAAYLIRRGMSADDAIARLRTICPGAIESDEQRRALAAFAQRQDWVV